MRKSYILRGCSSDRPAKVKQQVSTEQSRTQGVIIGETDGAGQASGQYSRPFSQAIKRPLWADRRTHRGLCSHVLTCVCVCVFICV